MLPFLSILIKLLNTLLIFGITKSFFITKAKTSHKTINKYYDLLNKYNKALLNGKTPDENFYY